MRVGAALPVSSAVRRIEARRRIARVPVVLPDVRAGSGRSQPVGPDRALVLLALGSIEIDFGEGEYRRCDQNICSAYEITAAMVAVDSASNMVRIDFAPDARFRADADGRSFTETIRRGPRKYESSGGCVHRGRDAQAHRRG